MGTGGSKIPRPNLNEDITSTFPYVRGSKEARDKSYRITRELKHAFSEDSKIVKLLLLGTGDSGKSTIVKQMKLLHPVNNRAECGFNLRDRVEARSAVYSNIAGSITCLLHAVDDLNIKLLDNEDPSKMEQAKSMVMIYVETLKKNTVEELKRNRLSANDLLKDVDGMIIPKRASSNDDVFQFCRSLSSIELDNLCPNPETVSALKYLWSSPSIQLAYQRRNEFQLIDSASYFLNDLDRLCVPNYNPTDEDILYSRIKTTGTVKIQFRFRHLIFNMYDVGGQRTERRKWIHCFDNVTAILYVISLSEYDQVIEEDPKVNRMAESLNLFEEMVNGIYLRQKPFVVFFNKHDLFEKKIEHKSIHCAFPDYRGENHSVHDSNDYIVNKYIGKNKTDANKRALYSHVVTATDTQLVKFVFAGVAETILNELLNNFAFQ